MRHWLSGNLRGVVAALLVSLIGAGFSAHAGLSALGAEDRAIAPDSTPRGYEAEDHFPGAALFHAVDDSQIPTGTTGTAPLPGLPFESEPSADDTVRAAAPFAFRGSATDRARALQCLTDAIYYEAAREPLEGQRAVAQVVLNRVRHPAFPATVCGVVYQGSERAGCQFSFACDGSMARPPERAYWERARVVAGQALGGSVFAPAGLATHYHTFAVKPGWNRALVMTGAFGTHFFHRWKGWWGTAAAFRQAYRGQEPLPGAHPPTLAAVVPLTSDAASAPTVPLPVPVQAARPEPSAPTSTYIKGALPESPVLDKWRESGKPLR